MQSSNVCRNVTLISNQSHVFIVSPQGPELLSKYVGESERAVREVRAFLLQSNVLVKSVFQLSKCKSPQRASEMTLTMQHAAGLLTCGVTSCLGNLLLI